MYVHRSSSFFRWGSGPLIFTLQLNVLVSHASPTTAVTLDTVGFANKKYSQKFIPVYADHLIIINYHLYVDPKSVLLLHQHTAATLELQQQLTLPLNYSFGALIQVMPPKKYI